MNSIDLFDLLDSIFKYLLLFYYVFLSIKCNKKRKIIKIIFYNFSGLRGAIK